MIDIKTDEEIKIMQEGGKILAEVLREVLSSAKPGVSEIEIETLADDLISKKGGEAAFKKVKGYKNATCLSTNNTVVHGIPSAYILQDGDILGVDCGVYLKGFYTDMSHSIIVGQNTDEKKTKFLKTGEEALNEAIKMAIPGNRVGHISEKIQTIVEEGGYSVVRSLIGHGVGKKLHEDPEVPGFLNKKIENTVLLEKGMTIAVEVIYNMGKSDISYASSDGWTIVTTDGSLSGLFERSIAITGDSPLILTSSS